MDILNEIRSQINSISQITNSSYLDSVLTHISRAEYYYIKGKEESDYFNDVIYRTNQAYEGALKESYKVLADKNDEEVIKKTPNDIEKYFEENDIFRVRVLQLFRNYRQEWRNKSTHDYKLVFDENEAFIALSSVSSFIHLLLKQIKEKVLYTSQQKKNKNQSINKIVVSDKSPLDKLVEIIKHFSKEEVQMLSNCKTEDEIIGVFHAYVDSIGKNIIVKREPRLNYGASFVRPDFIIKIDNQSIILELKKHSMYHLNNNIQQMQVYMKLADMTEGIIYSVNNNSSVNIESFQFDSIFPDKKCNIVVIN